MSTDAVSNICGQVNIWLFLLRALESPGVFIIVLATICLMALARVLYTDVLKQKYREDKQ